VGPVRYLLDTCTFLWHAQQPGQLSPAAIAALNEPESEHFLSDVSLWEISLKHSAGKLPLPCAPREWIPEKLAYHQLQSLALTHAAIFRSGELPMIHPDPFDRLLAAQAIESSLVMLSPDQTLSLLGASRVW
jgi:PIN domain nuclease of toxin-antitoxin system